MTKKALLAATSIALAFGVLMSREARADGKGQSTASGQYEIKIDNFSFTPASITVPAGSAVTWINKDDVPHIVVTKDGKAFKSPVLDTDQKFTHTFAQAGTYEYYCSIHPKMTGKVIVQ
jgi:amicyanin